MHTYLYAPEHGHDDSAEDLMIPNCNALAAAVLDRSTHARPLLQVPSTGKRLVMQVYILPIAASWLGLVVTLTNPATDAFTYTPNNGAHSIDSFTFKVNDGLVDAT